MCSSPWVKQLAWMKGQRMEQIREEMVTGPEELAACCAFLETCSHFGFDTEFIGEETYHPRLCLVQVATDDRLFVIDPLSTGPLDAFWKLVVDPSRVSVVHAGREEVRLCRLWTGNSPGNLFDLQLAAGLAGMNYPISHGNLVNQLLGVQIAKGETLTEWRARPLTPSQVRYAFDDVRFLLPLWRKLTSRLETAKRNDWAQEEFTRLAAAADPEEELLAEKWRKLRGLGALNRRQLAIVRGLYHWREETATRLNRPVRSICRDDLLIEIARRNPQRERDLQVVRGLPKRDLSDIIRIVATARELSPEQLPAAIERENDLPQVAMVTSVLNAVLADLCARWGLAQSLVATSNDVRRLVRAWQGGEPPPEDSQLSRGWRATHVLPELIAMLEGRRAVRIANPRSATPFAYEENGEQPS